MHDEPAEHAAVRTWPKRGGPISARAGARPRASWYSEPAFRSALYASCRATSMNGSCGRRWYETNAPAAARGLNSMQEGSSPPEPSAVRGDPPPPTPWVGDLQRRSPDRTPRLKEKRPPCLLDRRRARRPEAREGEPRMKKGLRPSGRPTGIDPCGAPPRRAARTDERIFTRRPRAGRSAPGRNEPSSGSRTPPSPGSERPAPAPCGGADREGARARPP